MKVFAGAPARAGGLEPGEVRVRLAWTGEIDPEGADRILSAPERARAARFRNPALGDRFRRAHLFLRRTLAMALDSPPEALEFDTLPGGRPILPERPEVHFSLSHSQDLVAVAMTRVGTIGVDVEEVDGTRAVDDLVSRYFSSHEVEEFLAATPGPERLDRFFRGWTRKEAFLKATGEGLSRSLASFTVSLDPVQGGLRWVDGEEAGAWWACDIPVPAGFRGAVAVLGEVSALHCEGPVTRFPEP